VSGLLDALQRAAPYGIEVKADGPPVAISSRQTLPLAMTLAELHANSCKYGAHARATGRLLVSWRLGRQGGRTIVTLLWQERGGAPITAEAAPSLGRDLVEGFVRHELGGSCDLRFPPEGAEHTIVFPVATPPTPPATPGN
jgi:two-component sensor histidine kinase